MRINKLFSNYGICSRKETNKLIEDKRVIVNGVLCKLGQWVEEYDEILLDGERVKPREKIYIALNKPVGITCTASEEVKDNIIDYINYGQYIFPVGRLDMYTSGALILTDDGDFVYKITHPKHEIEKTYTVTIKGIVTNEEVQKLRQGVEIDDNGEKYITKKANVRILKTDIEKDISRLEIVIHEGKNRQVRKMCEAVGRKVLALHRSKIGNIGVKDLKIGTWRYLKKHEIEKLL